MITNHLSVCRPRCFSPHQYFQHPILPSLSQYSSTQAKHVKLTGAQTTLLGTLGTITTEASTSRTGIQAEFTKLRDAVDKAEASILAELAAAEKNKKLPVDAVLEKVNRAVSGMETAIHQGNFTVKMEDARDFTENRTAVEEKLGSLHTMADSMKTQLSVDTSMKRTVDLAGHMDALSGVAFQEAKDEAAVAIQHGFRGHLNEKKAAAEKEKDASDQNNAATKIQSQFRGKNARNTYAQTRTETGADAVVLFGEDAGSIASVCKYDDDYLLGHYGVNNIRFKDDTPWNTGTDGDAFVTVKFDGLKRVTGVKFNNWSCTHFTVSVQNDEASGAAAGWRVLVPKTLGGVGEEKEFSFNFLGEYVYGTHLRLDLHKTSSHGYYTSIFWLEVAGTVAVL